MNMWFYVTIILNRLLNEVYLICINKYNMFKKCSHYGIQFRKKVICLYLFVFKWHTYLNYILYIYLIFFPYKRIHEKNVMVPIFCNKYLIRYKLLYYRTKCGVHRTVL